MQEKPAPAVKITVACKESQGAHFVLSIVATLELNHDSYKRDMKEPLPQ